MARRMELSMHVVLVDTWIRTRDYVLGALFDLYLCVRLI
jgi:hypothetical protein